MAIVAQKKLIESWYTPESEEGEEQKTEFLLKPLDGKQYLQIIAESETDSRGDAKITNDCMNTALRYGLKDWKNFNDENGKSVKFSRMNLGLLPPEILFELGGEIMNRSAMDENERKNS